MGEGEIKFYLDGDQEAPTICGTGTEDYFCGSYNFEDPRTHSRYVEFSTPTAASTPSPRTACTKAKSALGPIGSTSPTPSALRKTCR